MRAKEIKQLVDIVEKSTINELEVTRWGQKVRISKNPQNGNTGAVPAVQNTAVIPAAPAPVLPEPTKVEAVTPEPVGSGVPKGKSEGKNTAVIKSPMVGTFYRSPAPDADPYVKEGDMVSPGKVLCIIEAMKLMNEIEAEISGKIVEVLVEDAQPVEYNQPLFSVEPH